MIRRLHKFVGLCNHALWWFVAAITTNSTPSRCCSRWVSRHYGLPLVWIAKLLHTSRRKRACSKPFINIVHKRDQSACKRLKELCFYSDAQCCFGVLTSSTPSVVRLMPGKVCKPSLRLQTFCKPESSAPDATESQIWQDDKAHQPVGSHEERPSVTITHISVFRSKTVLTLIKKGQKSPWRNQKKMQNKTRLKWLHD